MDLLSEVNCDIFIGSITVFFD